MHTQTKTVCIGVGFGRSVSTLKAVNGPSIAIVTSGGGSMELVTGGAGESITTGQVFFVPAGAQPSVSAGPEGITLHIAFTEM